MSLIVDLRANRFYRLCRAALRGPRATWSLKPVVAEKELHLDSIQGAIVPQDPGPAARIARFRPLEDTRFRALFGVIEAETDDARQAGA
jgi:hypothetical protein